MYQEEKTFVLRFSLEARFPDDYEGDDDHYAWLRLWESRTKPELMKSIFESLRRAGNWTVHIRNRGKSPEDEIEIVVEQDHSTRSTSPPSFFP